MASSFNVMEAVWKASEKGEDGSLHYPEEVVGFLWENGFVDTLKYSLDQWRLAFEPFKQKDGHYKISHDEFLTLEKYRYKGEIKIPFDPMRINEGKYTDEGFGQLSNASIAPSCSLKPEALKIFLEELKTEFRQADDLILVKTDAKLKIKKLMEENPSPLRKLEILFDNLLKSVETQKKVEELDKQLSRSATPEQSAAVQTSAFVEGAASALEAHSKRLRQITKTKAFEETSPATEGDPLKKIKRSKKGLRG